jgi:hypothetical protein
MGKLAWYWHRLAAMSPGEMLRHARKKLRQRADARRSSWPVVPLDQPGAYPKLPRPEDAPGPLRAALRRDADDLLAGRWRAFTHLELRVDDPPQWQKDYLVGVDLATDASAFALDHRALPGGADIKLIWELSRWQHLTRLAMAAHVLDDARAAAKCVAWLEDWVKHNPPYRGWNWTSALEVGMRLIQFTWMDALLIGNAERGTRNVELEKRLVALRQEILPAHVWYAWRHQSFGSSANNHLLGELAGLILATVRWPELAKLGAPLEELQRRLEREVLAQFADDGGNKEQALNYQLFSWELCWHARNALVAAGRQLPTKVEDRLRRAAQFFTDVQVPTDPWDYGDSDNAVALPVCVDERRTVCEWHAWLNDQSTAPAHDYWLGQPMLSAEATTTDRVEHWRVFPTSGHAIRSADDLVLRWDLSPLGYLATQAHGHLDVLHLSVWREGVAMVIDPGTGCYYADTRLRGWLASRDAHNGVNPERWFGPTRLGPFLWSRSHIGPELREERPGDWLARLHPLPSEYSDLCNEWMLRRIELGQPTNRRDQSKPMVMISIFDGVEGVGRRDTALPFSVRWQFAPDTRLEKAGGRQFRVTRHGVSMDIELSADWAEVFAVTERSQVAASATTDLEREFAGTVSPAFRKIEWAPYLKLVARPQPGRTCVFRTTFLASPRS